MTIEYDKHRMWLESDLRGNIREGKANGKGMERAMEALWQVPKERAGLLDVLQL